MGAILVPVALVVGLLSHTWSVILLAILATIWVGVSSFVGQGHNEVFVGPRGIRRVVRDCEMIASWPSLEGLAVEVPGVRIVVFNLETRGITVHPTGRHRSHRTDALIRHPPQGMAFRLDREAADALVALIGERRPDVRGLAEWSTVSRPTAP
ncbi:MAG TPA: hypothetical protein VI138_06275 [Candidatus Dormibacteraeota bacterium]